MEQNLWLGGTLHEISPFGTGLIEERSTGRVYGFHRSMLQNPSNVRLVNGAAIRFQLNEAGTVQTVHVV